MIDMGKYRGIIPAFYACYDEAGKVSPERTRQFTEYLIQKGVKGLYVGGSSGECIYQSKEERKLVLEEVVKAAKKRITIIAHVACNNTEDSCELAAHAESLSVDAIASIPPIYFKLPDHAIADYWNAISASAPNTDFFIYNIPQLAGVALTENLLKCMMNNERLAGVKNSSLGVQDIRIFKNILGSDKIIFNGPDEQFVAGRMMGADGGIGGTYAVMPELLLKADECLKNGEFEKAEKIQNGICCIIYKMCEGTGNLYSIMKKILKNKGMDIGEVRAPLTRMVEADQAIVMEASEMIDAAIEKYCL